MSIKLLTTLFVLGGVNLYAGFGLADIPLLPRDSDAGVESKVISIDDLPVEKDAQEIYEQYLDGVAVEDRLKGDINCDGKEDIIAWREFATDKRGSYYQLIVVGGDGNLLWEGPTDKNINNHLIFGSWDVGISFPQVLADIDEDCGPELLAPVASSEFEPQYFKRLKWQKNLFVAQKDAILMRSKNNSKRYIWVEKYNGSGLNQGWVANLYPTKCINEAKADIVEMDKHGNATFKKVILEFDSKGARVKKVLSVEKK